MVDNLPANAFASANLTTGDLARFRQNLQMSRAVMTANIGRNVHYLRMIGRTGDWQYASGTEVVSIEPDAQFVVHPFVIQAGFIAWPENGTGSKPVGKMMRVVAEGNPVRPEELPPVAGSWTRNVQILMRCITGEDAGMDFDYSASTFGALNAYDGFNRALSTQSEADPERMYPVIKLGHQPYRHSQFGHIENPVLQIVRWMTQAETLALPYRDADGVVVTPTPAPAPPQAAPVEAPAATTTTTRRRRAAA